MARDSIYEVILNIFSSKLISEPPGTYFRAAEPAPISIFLIVIHNGMKHQLTTLAPTSFKESVYICVLCSLLRESVSEVIFNIFFIQTHFSAPRYLFHGAHIYNGIRHTLWHLQAQIKVSIQMFQWSGSPFLKLI